MRIIVIIFLVFWSCDARNYNMTNTKFLFKIDFQDFFKNDIVTFYLNDCVIFEDLELNSSGSTGLTDMILEVRENNQDIIVFKKDNEYVVCENSSKTINLTVVVNQVESAFKIDFMKGRYIGFDKKSNDEVLFNQATEAFEYD